MDESSFSSLETKDYSNAPREQVRYVGQPSAIRNLDPQDRLDAARLKEIITSPNVQHWMSDLDMSEADYLSWMEEQGPAKNRRHHLFAISGSKETNPEEIGEVQGFIYMYSGQEEKHQAQKLLDEKLLAPDDLEHKRLLEISYARSPNAQPGRVASAIMQSCLEVSKIMQRNDDSDPKNILILAYINPENIASVKVIENSGFQEIGTIDGYGEETGLNKVYKLDWDKLHQNMQSASIKNLT